MLNAVVFLIAAAVTQAPFHQTISPPYTFSDTIIRLRFDLHREIVYGHETAIVQTAGAARKLRFDSAGIRYDRINVDGKAASYHVNDAAQTVSITLRHASRARAPVTVDFFYHTHPQAGLYFIKPDGAYHNVTPEIWTQGEPTDNHRWFPTWDEPNAKTPSELIITVPRDWTVIGNGFLKSHTTSGDGRRLGLAFTASEVNVFDCVRGGPVVALPFRTRPPYR